MASTHRTAVPSSPASTHTASARLLKKYPNRRLYDTEASSYITLTDIRQMVLSGRDFIVRDAKTGEDLTRSILLQIILEAETAGMQMFSARALAQIIRFQGHAMQDVMGAYLEKNLQSFTDLQNQLAQQSTVLSPELWAQFLNGQAPALQGLMGNYLEQSKNMFSQLQEQMVKQAGSLFPVMPGMGLPKR